MDDGEIFAEIYPQLRRFAAVVGAPAVEPDDLLQEAVARTLARQALADLDDPAMYLRRAIVRLAANDRRSRWRREGILRRFGPARGATSDAYSSDLAELTRAPPDQRAVLYLHLFENLSHAEVGAFLGISAASSRARLSRGLKRLLAVIDEGIEP